MEHNHPDCEALAFLAGLALRLNSTLDVRQVVSQAIISITDRLAAEAGTIFLLSENEAELKFWALEGEKSGELAGRSIPAKKGLVGWVIENGQPLEVAEARKDPRFFSGVDDETNFTTREVLCVPLKVGGQRLVGALQVLNAKNPHGFDPGALQFLTQCSHYVAPAIDNAQTHERLKRQSEKLEMLDRRKSDLATIIAHEFRTPLSIIRSSSEMLTSGALIDRKSREQMAETLERGVTRLTRVVSQVMNLSLVSRDSIELQCEPLAAENLVRETWSQFDSVAASRSIELTAEGRGETAQVFADHTLLLIVFGNLVSNAIRFTPNGGNIIIGASAELGAVEFFVSDTGIGIDEKEIPLLFEKFYEGKPTINHSSGSYEFRSAGLGLGLATASAILKAHHSAIDVRSVPGEGSRFSFRLPIL